MRITVPLGIAIPNPAGWTVANWNRSLSQLPAGTSYAMSGTDLVITLPSSIPTNGQSTTLQLSLTPPDYVTFNNTTWSLSPSIAGSNIQTVTAAPATATATAKADMVLSKRALEGNVGVLGDLITYRITAYCQGVDSFFGHLALQSFDLVDTLPNTVTYVSSSPAGVYNAGTRTVTWTNPFPARCLQPDTNQFEYDITVRINDGTTYPGPVVPNGGSLVNPVQSNYRSISDTATRTASAQHTMTIYHGAPPTGNVLSKSGRGFLNANNNNQGTPTYAGHWLPEAPQPQIWGQAEASYRINIASAPVGFSSELIDPMPCLDNYVSTASSGTYSSKVLSASTTDLSANPLTNLCQRPAFHPIRFTLSPRYYDAGSTIGIRQMYTDGWRPAAILKDGTRIDLTLESEQTHYAGASMWFAIPTAYREQVSMIHLPHHTSMGQLEMALHGYADPLLIRPL